MITLGLTGCIGSGKSTVSGIFRENGVPIIDADIISRQVVRPNQEGWLKIVTSFGPDILLPDETIDRIKLGHLVFNDASARTRLNNCLHPIIISELKNQMFKMKNSSDAPLLVADVPLLFECRMQHYFDFTVLVYADHDTLVRRLVERDRITAEQACLRLNAQMNINQKKDLADLVIDNSGTLAELHRETLRLYQQFLIKLKQ